jgi:hypothetical protein
MEPIRPGQLHENIESAVVTFSDTGEVRTLTTRERSASQFFPRFMVGDDEIQLRLDWSDLDSNGQPTLDADFIDRETGTHRALRGKRRVAHHTESSPGEGRRYEWELNGFSRQFSVAVTWRATVSENLQATDRWSAEVIRATDRKPEHG